MRFDPLVADTHQPEGKTEQLEPEYGLVVGPKRLGPTKTFNAAGYCME